jgi:hypothetical protein
MIAVVVVLALALQDDVPPRQAEIDKAIKAGADALLARAPGVIAGKVAFNYRDGFHFDPLLLYTLIHCGVSLDHEVMKQLFTKVYESPYYSTYQVSLTAAALAAINPIRYQAKLAQCAQYLVDYQCENGQWSYGDKYEFPKVADDAAKRTVAAVRIKRDKKLGLPAGDNSNSQYAALGLKACVSAGCEIDPSVFTRAMEWWEKSQQKDGGWGYDNQGIVREKLGTYGSMTAGAVSSLIILKQLKKADLKNAKSVTRGFDWLADRFTVEDNPNPPAGLEDWRYYYLYAIERAGDLYPTEKIGKRGWYGAGATHLLKIQRSDGMWVSKNNDLTIADTCFALLFLERSMRPVPTGVKEPEPK